ncbi:hypothetical protein V8E55_010192 [Tylopilus felleus]
MNTIGRGQSLAYKYQATLPQPSFPLSSDIHAARSLCPLPSSTIPHLRSFDMVLLIKNKHASFEDVARLSLPPAGDTPTSGRLAKLGMQRLRNAGVPKAMSLPHINLFVEGGSLGAVLNADLHKLKPKELIARRVKSAKEDLRQLFDNATASDSGISSSLDSSVSLAVSVPTPLDEKDEDDEDHIHRLTAIAQSWLDFERLFSQSRSRFDQTIEEARHNFCQALVQSLSDHSPVASPLQFSSDLADLPSFDPVSSLPGYSPAPSFTTWTNQTTITCPQFESSVLNGKPNQLPEFSDEELQREFDKFSFHSSQDEEWTSEVESRKQNAINRALLDMKRKLAFPVPRLSSYFSDDSLADTAAQQTFVNPPPSCSSVSCKGDDNDSSYSADKEDETEDNDKSVSLSTTPPDSPVGAPLPVVDDAAKQADPEFGAEHIDDGIENVSEALAPYVPRFLTCIPEESLADEYENEPITEPPALSFRRPGSQYRKISSFTRQCTSILDPIYENENSSPVANTGKTLRRVGNFVDLRIPVILSTVSSTSSIESTCETVSVRDEASLPEPQGQRLRRVPGYLDLRKAFSRTDMSTGTPSSLYSTSEHSLQGRYSFEERQCSSNLQEGCKVRPVSPGRLKEGYAKPPIPPKPSGFLSHQKRIQRSSAASATSEPSSLCSRCDPLSSLPLWSCAKITRSTGKRGRPIGESTKALKKRLDSVRIDPETIHGHPAPQDDEKRPSILSINASRRAKVWNCRKREKNVPKPTAMRHTEKQKIPQNKIGRIFWRP